MAAPIVRKVIAYFKVGALCALLDVAVFWVLLQLTGLKYASFALSFFISTGLNYYLSVLFVFARAQRTRETAIAMVYVASAVAVSINLAAFSTAIELFAVPPVLAKIIGIGSGFAWNFGSRYFWIFR
jgi:putative flippase GtrA